ncbi:MAG: 16S rRNA (uracil(1498)-N(3))-methyltransferase [Bacteroidetes bacterium GWF2_42_66]|nr:MAG: 16S rRNA (uracil(1498)-N(3))-methyltransferase [Bacteroidetes bacterium GWE2_42_39]OFY43745.1 MAG: 16S rRNA (uracil(1498)-N(3))-methyltransferase [Bacteroidetes bacterium GWF2_42_66]HBL76279.1 16S rRNA (uracil(1498)-N(3))-methyltransferase [Prolixibacteraceae bacterium]HCU60517.1 16S rRNA (uracil(1498)-N(3))-methyltransferase [Prolixibacteraceae bacterium]
MHLFYTPGISGKNYVLNEDESKHCVRVLRLVEKDCIILVDGKGGFYEAMIVEAHPKRCSIEVVKSIQEYGKKSFYLHVAIAPTKNIERFEWFLEKATEFGVHEITPLLCANSERRTVKDDRLEKIMVSAMKQSLKAYLPRLNPMAAFNDFVRKDQNADRFIAHCEDQEKIHLKNIVKPAQNVVVLIGPEGDFSSEEIRIALQSGYQPVSLGDSRLRTETAGVAAVHIVNLANES